MINENRVIAETRLAIYEAHGAAADDRINSYYKSDYVTGKVLVSFLCGTIAFLLIAAVYAFYHFEDVMLQIYNSDIAAMIASIITNYCIFIAIILVLTFLIASYRYNRAGDRLEAYYDELYRLAANYKREGES